MNAELGAFCNRAIRVGDGLTVRHHQRQGVINRVVQAQHGVERDVVAADFFDATA